MYYKTKNYCKTKYKYQYKFGVTNRLNHQSYNLYSSKKDNLQLLFKNVCFSLYDTNF